MNRALVLSVSLHAIGVVAVIAAPTARTPRWQPRDAIAVDLVAAASRPRAPKVAPPTPAEPAVEAKTEAPREVVEAKPEPEKKKAKQPVAPRTIRRDAPPRDNGPTLEERIRKRLDEVFPSSESTEPEPAAPTSPASGETGGSSAEVRAVDFPFAWYLNVLRTRITDSWDPPGESLLTGRDNKVTVSFRVYRDGRVSDVRVGGSTNTPGLDASARRAVERAQPFPPLPDAYVGESLEVSVRFTAQGSQ